MPGREPGDGLWHRLSPGAPLPGSTGVLCSWLRNLISPERRVKKLSQLVLAYYYSNHKIQKDFPPQTNFLFLGVAAGSMAGLPCPGDCAEHACPIHHAPAFWSAGTEASSWHPHFISVLCRIPIPDIFCAPGGLGKYWPCRSGTPALCMWR